MTDVKRQCGECTLCCRLLPVQSINKPSNTRCAHQRHTGCKLYHDRSAFPLACAAWTCRWLINKSGATSRPDRLHIVIDFMPDFVTLTGADGNPIRMEVIQCWIDPRHPDAHLDPAFREFVEEQAREGRLCLLRYSGTKAKVLFAPCLTPHGEFYLRDSSDTGMTMRPQHSQEEIFRVLSELERERRK